MQIARLPGKKGLLRQLVHGKITKIHPKVTAVISDPVRGPALFAERALVQAAGEAAEQARLDELQAAQERLEAQVAYTHTGVGAIDVTRLPDGTLTVAEPVTFAGLPPTHPLGTVYTGPSPTQPSGAVITSAGFTTLKPVTDVLETIADFQKQVRPARETSAPRGDVATVPTVPPPSIAAALAQPEELAPVDIAEPLDEIEVLAPSLAHAIVLPPSGPMDYTSMLLAMPPETQQTLEEMADNMAQHLTDIALGAPDPSRIIERIGRAPSPSPDIPDADVCEEILKALRALKADLSNAGKKGKVIGFMNIIGRATAGSGSTLLAMAKTMQTGTPNAGQIDAIYAEAFKLCALMNQVATRTRTTMQQVQRLGRPGGRSYGGKEVIDRSQDARRQQDLSSGVHVPDKPDLSIEPVRVSHPGDRNYGVSKPKRSDLDFLGDYTVPVPNTATNLQLKKPGRSAAETEYNANLKAIEKFTPESIPSRQHEFDRLVRETKELCRQFGFPKPILPSARADVEARIRRETNVITELKRVQAIAKSQQKEYNKIKQTAGKTATQAERDIKSVRKNLKKAMGTHIKAHTKLIDAKTVAANKPTKANIKKVESAQKALTGAATNQSALSGTLSKTETLRDSARRQQNTAATQADLTAQTRMAAGQRSAAVKADLKILKDKGDLGAESRRRDVVDSVQLGHLDRQAINRGKTKKAYENLGLEMAATLNPNNEAALQEERFRQAAVDRNRAGVDAQAAAFRKASLLAAEKEARDLGRPGLLGTILAERKIQAKAPGKKKKKKRKPESETERQVKMRKQRERTREKSGAEELLDPEIPAFRPVTVDATRINEILRAGVSTGYITAEARNELVSVVAPQIMAETKRLGFEFPYPDFKVSESIASTSTRYGVTSEMDIFTGIDLLEIAGYSPSIISELKRTFHVDPRPVSKRSVGKKSKVQQLSKHRPAKPKPKPATPRKPPRPTTPQPNPGKGGPSPSGMETQSELDVIKEGTRKGRLARRSPSPNRSRSGSRHRSRSGSRERKKPRKKPPRKKSDTRVRI